MSIKFKQYKQYLELDDQIHFGEYSGKSISYMMEFEPEYLLWASNRPGLLCLCKTLLAKLPEKAALAKQEKATHKYQQQSDEFLDDVPF